MQNTTNDLPVVPGLSHVAPMAAAGGSSAMYSAVQDSSGARVALKVLEGKVSAGMAEAQYQIEREALSRLQNEKGIVGLIDSGHTGRGRLYLVMPLLDRSLDDVLRQRGPLSWARMALIMSQIADALSRAHSAGVLHRDIKPANILLTEEGAPFLADFGIALVRASNIDGLGRAFTPDFTSPEIVRNEAPTMQSDVFSLGVTCLAALLGRSPYREHDYDTDAMIIERVHLGPTPSPRQFGLDGHGCELLDRCLQPEAQHRPSAASVAEALKQLIPGARTSMPKVLGASSAPSQSSLRLQPPLYSPD